nr:hypothetical protein [Tanacetum cinerariifolium]
VLVTKPHNKTPYALLHGRTPSIGFMRPFGCPMTILNTLDSLGKFDGNVDEGFLVGYSVSSKAFRVFNSRTHIVQETLHVNFLENKPNVAGSGPTWLFDIDTLIKTMHYQPNTNGDAAFDEKEPDFDVKKPKSKVNVSPSSSAQSKKQDDKTKREAKGKSHVESFTGYRNLSTEFKDYFDNSINEVHAVDNLVLVVGQISPNNTNTFSAAGPLNVVASPTQGKSSCIDASQLPDNPDMPELEDITYSDDEDDVGAEADFNNLETSITVTTQTRSMARVAKYQGGLSQMFNDDLYTSMARVAKDPSWIKAMQEELLQFKMQKSAFLYGTIEKEVYVCEPLGFEDLIILTKFIKWSRLTDGKLASSPIYTEKPLLKDPDGKDVDVHIYISMIGSLMYLTSSRPDIMFAVCACARFQVTPKASHLHAVKRIFRYLKGKPHLGLWYPKDSPFDLVAYSDSNYASVSLDQKSTTGGCQFLGCRLISWQCKKQTVVATSSTEAEYVAAASCCAQVLWIQNQLLDY